METSADYIGNEKTDIYGVQIEDVNSSKYLRPSLSIDCPRLSLYSSQRPVAV